MSAKRGGGSAGGSKFKMAVGLPVAAVMNCADNSGAKNLYVVSVFGISGRLNKLPAAGVGDMILATGPVTADPFISPLGFTITPALST